MRTNLLAIILALALCGSATAADPGTGLSAATTADATTTAADDDIDKPDLVEEVTIEAHRQKLGRLRQRINKSVDDFYDAFNKANTVPGYETTCSDDKPAGSYIRRHICTPQFVHMANEDETQGFFYGYSPVPAGNLVALRMRGYKKLLEQLIHTDPQVRAAALRFEALNDQYAAVGRERVKSK